MSSSSTQPVADTILTNLSAYRSQADVNLEWIKQEMSPYFLNLNKEEVEALTLLTMSLDKLKSLEKVTLVDRESRLMIAQLSTKGSIYRTIHDLPEKALSYTEITTSFNPLPDSEVALEVIRCDFKELDEVNDSKQKQGSLDSSIREGIAGYIKKDYPNYSKEHIDGVIDVIYSSNPQYILKSSAERVARVMRIYIETQLNSGIYLNIEPTKYKETRVSFGVTNPPHAGFLTQILEVFQRLEIGVRRAYLLSVTNGLTPYDLATFYVKPRDKSELNEANPLFTNLKLELFSTQITSTTDLSYANLIKTGIMSGPDSTLISAFIGFCHANLAHNAPDVYERGSIIRAFHHVPSISIQLVELFLRSL